MKKSTIAIISGIVGGIISFGLTIGLLILPISSDFKKSLDPCPYVFQEIKLLEMTPDVQTAEKEAIEKHWNLLEEYDSKKCPTYEGLELQLSAYRLGILDTEYLGLTDEQITDIKHIRLGCAKLGNKTACDEMTQQKIDYYKNQNKN